MTYLIPRERRFLSSLISQLSTLLKPLESEVGVTGGVLSGFKPYLTGCHWSVIHWDQVGANWHLERHRDLGPIRFSIYTIAVGRIGRYRDLRFHLYAGDTQLHPGFKPLSPSSVNDAFQRITACIIDINTWITHFLKLIGAKTESFIIYHQFKTNCSPCRFGTVPVLFNEAVTQEILAWSLIQH